MSRKPVYNEGERRIILQGKFEGRVFVITQRIKQKDKYLYRLEFDGKHFLYDADAIMRFSDPYDGSYRPDPNHAFKWRNEDVGS